MFSPGELSDELQALKNEVSRLMSTAGEDVFDTAKSGVDAVVDQLKAALNELGETLSEGEDHVEELIANHPIATVASSFALGIVIGFILRRH